MDLNTIQFQGDILQRLSGGAVAEVRGPRDIEAAIGRLKGGDLHPARREDWHPGGVGAELRPARTAERENRRPRRDRLRFAVEPQADRRRNRASDAAA